MHDPDQYSTDLTKSLKLLHNASHSQTPSAPAAPTESARNTVIFTSLSGRADHAFSALHTLHQAAADPALDCGNLYLFTSSSIIFLLEKGTNIIKTPFFSPLSTDSYPLLSPITENVGTVPIGCPAVVTLRGFEWDVTDWETSFGTQVSTSNCIRKDEVVVETTERVVFTMELRRRE